jgi:predicted nucleic acid-binding protein
MFILDTNVISEARKGNCHPGVAAWIAAQATEDLYISSITVLEIQRGISQAERQDDAPQAAVFTRWLDEFVLPTFAARILSVDHVVARMAGRLIWAGANDFRDPIIAATGLVYGATVVTRNSKHFQASGVLLINPWEYQAQANH